MEGGLSPQYHVSIGLASFCGPRGGWQLLHPHLRPNLALSLARRTEARHRVAPPLSPYQREAPMAPHPAGPDGARQRHAVAFQP